MLKHNYKVKTCLSGPDALEVIKEKYLKTKKCKKC